jgi:hypothetical protein
MVIILNDQYKKHINFCTTKKSTTMMAKKTDKQRRQPVISKNNKSKTKKRNINESTESTTVNDTENSSKKNKINNIEKSLDETKPNKNDNDKNIESDSTDDEEKNYDDKNINDNVIDDMKTDSEDEKSDDEESVNSKKDSKSNKIVPLYQERPQVNDSDFFEPIVEQLPEDANEASLFTSGYCETVVGFSSAGKKNMLENLSDTEISILRGWVRKEVFRMIKFLSPANLGIDSSIMTKLYTHISVYDDSVKMKKYSGVRYLLQRQLNSKRNYCIATIVSQMKGMIF